MYTACRRALIGKKLSPPPLGGGEEHLPQYRISDVSMASWTKGHFRKRGHGSILPEPVRDSRRQRSLPQLRRKLLLLWYPVRAGSRYPGQRTLAVRAENLAQGVPVNPAVWREVQEIAAGTPSPTNS